MYAWEIGTWPVPRFLHGRRLQHTHGVNINYSVSLTRDFITVNGSPISHHKCLLEFKVSKFIQNMKILEDQLVKDLTTEKQGKSTTIQDKSGKCLTEENEILNRWTEYCSDLYNYMRLKGTK